MDHWIGLCRLPFQTTAWPQLRCSTILPNAFAVDEYAFDTIRRFAGCLEGGAVNDRSGIEKNQIGKVALAHEPPILDAKCLGRQKRHLADGLLEGEESNLSRVMTENAWKCSPQTRMGVLIVGEPI